MSTLIVDYIHRFGTFDFTGSNPRNALAITQGVLRDAQSRDLKKIKLIHKLSDDDSIVVGIWKSIESHVWDGFVPKCSESNLISLLVAKLCAEKYKETNLTFSDRGYVKIDSFEFRLGSTILPVLTMGLPISSEYFRGKNLRSVDLHGMNLSEAIASINGAIKEAIACSLQEVEFIHGYHSGTAIRNHLWKTIDSNSLTGVPKCRQENLVSYLQNFNFNAVLVGENSKILSADERRRREETKVDIGRFSFRSGSTKVPIGEHQW